MAGHKGDIIAEWKQFGLDRGDQRGMIATLKVGAADAAFKQYVADKGVTTAWIKEYDVTWRMPGAMNHPQA